MDTDKSSYTFLRKLFFAVDGSGNNILHYLVLAGVSTECLADVLNMNIRNNRGHWTEGTLCCYPHYDRIAARNGDVRGIGQQPNNSNKTPRDLAIVKGRKDFIELFDKFHSAPRLKRVMGWIRWWCGRRSGRLSRAASRRLCNTIR